MVKKVQQLSVGAAMVALLGGALFVCHYAPGALARETGIGLAANAIAQASSGTAKSAALEVVIVGSPARKTLVLTSSQPARIEAIEQTPIHSKLSAYVDQVLVDVGDVVKRNQELLRLSIPELEAELQQKESLLAQARSELRQADADIRVAEAAEVSARARVLQAQARIEFNEAEVTRWKSELTRIEQLVANGSLTRQLLDETRQKSSAAGASHRESLAAVELAKALIAQQQAEVEKALAQRDAAESRIKVAQANIEQTKSLSTYRSLRSPFDGAIIARQVDSGHFVQPSATPPPLFVVARTDVVRVFVTVPEVEAPYVDIGDNVTIEVQALRGAEFSSKISRTSVALEASNRALTTIVDIENKNGRLKPGMYATARITLQEQRNALTLPLAAMVRSGKESFCYRLVNGQATKAPLKLGIRVGDEFEITEGVTESDTVILNKASTLKDGQQVETAK